MSFFDECYQTRADLSHKPNNWKEFWFSELQELESIPKEIVLKKEVTTMFKAKNQLNLRFNSVDSYQLNTQLITTAHPLKKLPTIVIFPDYLEKFSISKSMLNHGFLICLIQLRGHQKSLATINENGEIQERESYGYFSKNLENMNKYYMCSLLLDAYQAIDVLVKERIVDPDRIGVWGRGVGAVMALFVARFSGRISSQVIESPSFCGLDNLDNLKGKHANEIHSALKKKNKVFVAQLKRNMRYFDSAFFAESLKTPTAFITDLENENVSPKETFALFNELQGEKEMHLFTGDSHESIEEKNKKNHHIVQSYFSRTL